MTEFEEYCLFFAERIPTKDATAFLVTKAQKKKALEKRGQLLDFRKMDDEMRNLTSIARKSEWDNYKKFEAVKVISKAEAKEYILNGAGILPMQWLEVDKNEKRRKESKKKDIKPDVKGRMVARGDLSRVFNRSDSPTAEKECTFILFSFAAARRLRVQIGDLDHGYFQGEKRSRPHVLKQPPGGVPDDAVKSDDMLLAVAPIYGTRDAGRGLWKRIRVVLVAEGMVENFMFAALYTYSMNGVILLMMATHVDDCIWAMEPEMEEGDGGTSQPRQVTTLVRHVGVPQSQVLWCRGGAGRRLHDSCYVHGGHGEAQPQSG